MDELKKDEILEESEEAVEADAPAEETVEDVETDFSEEIPEAEEIAEEKSELEAELEEIRDMFQKELDAAREGNDTEMLIQELDEEVAAEEEENLPKCECCGEITGANWIRLQDGKKLCTDCCETYDRFKV